GQAVLFSSHVLSEVERVCDRVAILRQGELVHVQTMSQLQQGRLGQARFQGAAPAPPPLPERRVRPREGDRPVVGPAGPPEGLLGWLASQSLTELRLEPLGLNAVYHRFHGSTE